MTHEKDTTLQHTRRSEQDVDLKAIFELKKTTSTHEEDTSLHKKKIIKKQIDRIEATSRRTRLLEENDLQMIQKSIMINTR